jgi:hypothetical protein
MNLNNVRSSLKSRSSGRSPTRGPKDTMIDREKMKARRLSLLMFISEKKSKIIIPKYSIPPHR